MEIDHGEEEDPFLAFIEYARSVIAPTDEGDGEVENGNGAETSGPGWSWIASRILKTCIAYSSGVTAAILLSDLSQVLDLFTSGLCFLLCLAAEKMHETKRKF